MRPNIRRYSLTENRSKPDFKFSLKMPMLEPLEVWGNANKGRDIVYIKDVISAFVRAIESDTAEGLYNISSCKAPDIKQEAKIIAKVF
ncbi:MAG: NAD-dependent epimerase/dehydratase family protein [Bdellovibrionota bacterium]